MDAKIIQTIQEYFKTQPVEKAWIFGSFARGEETPDSDIDILVIFDRENKSIGIFEHIRMTNTLENILGRKVDLIENGTLLPFATESAENDKQLIYERAS